MRTFTNYMRRKIARFHRECFDVGKTIKEFGITYKELYKVIDKSPRMFNKEITNKWELKRCPTCTSFFPATEEYYYKRTNWFLCSSCKLCMKRMSTNYQKINRKKVNAKRKQYYLEYYHNNKTKKQKIQKTYYKRYRNNISKQKQKYYRRSKFLFLKRLTRNL